MTSIVADNKMMTESEADLCAAYRLLVKSNRAPSRALLLCEWRNVAGVAAWKLTRRMS